MKKLIRPFLAGLLCTFFTYSSAQAGLFNIRDNWLDYGDGAINISNVFLIEPNVSYILTLESDDEFEKDGQFIFYTPSWYKYRTENKNLEDFLSWFPSFQENNYYYTKLDLSIFFDSFELTYLNKKFLKLPDPEVDAEVFNQLVNEEKFINFLELLKIEFEDEIDFDLELSQDDYFKLLKEVKEPTEEDIKEIETTFKDLMDTYEDIVN